jgi:hypothetical protein
LWAALLVAVLLPLAFVGSASAVAEFGISVLKDCRSPVNIGDPYSCEFSFVNRTQASKNTVRVVSMTDVVHAAAGDQSSTTPLNSTTVGATGNANGWASTLTTCDATGCTVAFGGEMDSPFISHYAVQLGDFPVLGDTVTMHNQNLCDVISAGCPTSFVDSPEVAQAVINPLQTQEATTVRDGADSPVTSVTVGTTVHDFVIVSDVLQNEPTPTGNVNIDWFTNGTCTGPATANSGSIGPLVNGQLDATGFTQTPTLAGQYSFKAHFEGGGGGAFARSDGPCEPLEVVDAFIQITPQSASNAVGNDHVLTITVTATGAGILAPGTATASIVTPPSTTGSFVGPSSCSYAGGAATASCTVTITSALAGLTQVQASSTIGFNNAAGTVSRTTGTADDVTAGCTSGCDKASKLWISTFVLNSAHNVITTIVAPATVHDQFQAAPGVTGTVTFTLYDTPDCSGNPDPSFPAQSVPLTLASNGVVESMPITLSPTTTRSFAYGVHYEKDPSSAFPSQNATCEPFTVTVQIINPGACVLGYPDNSNLPRSAVVFNESTVLVSAGVFGTGAQQHVGVFATDEHALTLGVDPGVTPFPGSVPNGGVSNPGVGVLTVTDAFGRPLYPSMFITDITNNLTSRTGDWQQLPDNSTAVPPTRIFGTWKSATQSGSSITPGPDPAKNDWNLGTGADPAPNATSLGYGTEVAWNTSALGLQPGHAYRLLVMVHDGDQNKVGGDVGQACVNVVMPTPPAPDANIRVTPQSSTNVVNTNRSLTAHVNVNTGSGYTNAPDGTAINFTLQSGPGGFLGPSSCTTAGATGSCSVTVTSAAVGTTGVRAATDVTVGGSTLHRETDDSNLGDGLDARIGWSPPPPKAALVARATGSNTTIASPSFTLKANTTYLVFAFTSSASGDGATPSSTFTGSPTFHPIGAGSQVFNTKNYDFAWWLNGGASDSTGGLTITFAKPSGQSYLEVVELNGNNVTNPIVQSAYAEGNNTNPYTANLPAAPAAGDNEVAFLTTQEDLGGTAPLATPAMTNLSYDHAGPGSQGIYASDTTTQSLSFAGNNKHWGTVAVEINHA